MPEGWKQRIRRWLTRNTADTRTGSGPPGRTYTASFARVWDALLEVVESQRRWSLQHADEERGLLTVSCRSRVFGFVDDLSVWVSLDFNGLTRVEARSAARTGRGDFGTNRRRLTALMRNLDGLLGERSRIAGDGSRRSRPGGASPR